MPGNRHELYNGRRVLEYLSAERVMEMLVMVDEFYRHSESFEKSGENAKIVLDYIERIRHSVPNEVRGSLPDNFNLSNRTLASLEERCQKALNTRASA